MTEVIRWLLPISPFLKRSSFFARRKISFKYGRFFALFGESLSEKKLDRTSFVASSSLATVRFSFWMSTCCSLLGLTTMRRMCLSR